MAENMRWGILATGSIAHKFAEGLRAVPDAELAAVGSRTQSTADQFGDQHGIPRRHASYEALAADPEVDVIYIATPHPMHRPNAILCLEHDKAVLCEKPFTVNAREARAVIGVARKRKTFLMEAMWTRFLPTVTQARRWIAEGAIGELRMVEASFGFRGGPDVTSRILAPELGGGSLLDVGVYPISLASMVFGGPPQEITGMADVGKTGVDEQAAMILRYPNGALAILACAVRTNTLHNAVIMGTDGMIVLEAPFWCGTVVTLDRPGEAPIRLELPLEGNGYNYQAVEVMRRMRAGNLESDIMPLDETVTIMETMDALRQQWGVKYPME
jgi:predicted dehydrogenase